VERFSENLESGQFVWVLGLGTEQCPVRHWQHLYLSLLQTLLSSQLILFVGLG
jgi:hypothetical protein